jgi:hypothetical protein
MPASVVRRERRQFLGANRKVRTFRWIGRQTVGVCQLVRAPCLLTAKVVCVKAEDGAERSFSRHREKRRRGQRVGKRRSRGGKPRSNSPIRPKPPKGVSARQVNHSGRKIWWAERRRAEICRSKHFRRFSRILDPFQGDDGHRALMFRVLSGTRGFDEWALYLRSLRRHAVKLGIPRGANPFSRSAVDFLLTNTSHGGGLAFLDILEGLRKKTSPSAVTAFHEAEALRDEEEPDLIEDPPVRKPKPRAKKAPVKKTTGSGSQCSCRIGASGPTPGCPSHDPVRVKKKFVSRWSS